MKPGIYTTEFATIAGALSTILSGEVSSTHVQIIVGVIASVYTASRTILKAVTAWKAPKEG